MGADIMEVKREAGISGGVWKLSSDRVSFLGQIGSKVTDYEARER